MYPPAAAAGAASGAAPPAVADLAFDHEWTRRFQDVTGDMNGSPAPPEARTGTLWDLVRHAPIDPAPPRCPPSPSQSVTLLTVR
jgi:hypothetical protein